MTELTAAEVLALSALMQGRPMTSVELAHSVSDMGIAPVMRRSAMDIRELDRRAMGVTAELIPGITPAQLDGPTPCGQWLLRDLLAHIVGQYYGFALAASGQPADLDAFRPRPVGEGLASTYAAAAALVTRAFAEDRVLDRAFYLPEIRDGGPYPAPMAIGTP